MAIGKVTAEVKTIQTGIRGCGERKMYSLYLTSGSGDKDGALPLFTRLNPPVPCEDRPIRGPVTVDGWKILSREPETSWLIGASADHAQKLRADQWGIDTFGMTVSKRITIGECEGSQDADTAIKGLVTKLRFSGRLLAETRNLTLLEVQNIPRATEPFMRIVRSFQEYVLSKDGSHLLSIVANVWRLSRFIPTKNQEKVIPVLQRMLILLGLPKDAIALKQEVMNTQS